MRPIVTKNICEIKFGAATLLSIKAPRKRLKPKRDLDMSFGELVQRPWQPESEDPEPKTARAKKKTVSRKARGNSEDVARGAYAMCGDRNQEAGRSMEA